MLRWIFSTLSRLAQPEENDADPWLRDMRQAERYLDAGKLDKAEAVMRPLLSSPLSDERRQQTLYTLGIAVGQQGNDREAAALLEEAFKLVEAIKPDDTGRLVSTLQNWLVSLERAGEKQKAATVEARVLTLSDRLISELWTFDDDSDEWVHIPTAVRFPESFGDLHRTDVGFDNPLGFDARVTYTLTPPRRGKVVVELKITDETPSQGLVELSEKAVAMLGLDDAHYKEAKFQAGLEAMPTGIRRLWPFFQVNDESWNLETFFVARGHIHISIFKLCPPGDVIETGESLYKMLMQFDWPRPDG